YEYTPDYHVHDLLAKASYSTHPLGRPIIGGEKQIQAFSRDMLIDYMDAYYIPQNMVISIAGNVDADFIQTVENYFSPLPSKDVTVTREKPAFETNLIRRTKETEQAHVCFGYQGLSVGDPLMS